MKKSSGRNSGKFIPLSPADIANQKILLPGRRECNCEASRHNLINNCMECGRVVCEQEGSGPCFFCGKLVCTPKEQDAISKQNKTSFKLYNKLMNTDESKIMPKCDNKKLQEALEHRNKLLEYDRTVEKRTKVIDDENDFLQVDNNWLTKKQREVVQKKQEEVYDQMHNRRQQKITLDFAGRQVVEETVRVEVDEDELLKSDISIFERSDRDALDIPENLQLVYEDPNSGYQYNRIRAEEAITRDYVRIQDKNLHEMSDEGICLSVQQPYASLLVSGIKTHEGRDWYTSHRGRLWIHSGAKIPTEKEIEEIEKRYRLISSNCNFPKKYPTGGLMGCVDLVDCLPQEEYQIQFPRGEIASPYVFICENAQELNMKFGMKGKHKLFNMDSNLHHAAKKTLIKKI